MPSRALRGLLVSVIVLAAGAASAQQPPAKPDLDAIPDKMPFNVPYGLSIGADKAHEILVAAVTESKKRGWAMNISVVDTGGLLVAFERMDGAQLASISISQHKARAAVMYRRETKVFENAIQNGGLNYIMTLDDVIGSRGGIPLVADGKIIGAIGCSGGTGSQDEVIAKAGAAVVNK
jgi:glc operon protein GlcG